MSILCISVCFREFLVPQVPLIPAWQASTWEPGPAISSRANLQFHQIFPEVDFALTNSQSMTTMGCFSPVMADVSRGYNIRPLTESLGGCMAAEWQNGTSKVAVVQIADQHLGGRDFSTVEHRRKAWPSRFWVNGIRCLCNDCTGDGYHRYIIYQQFI